MSDPLSTSEIEDVLSSIRRLVSDDLRPSSRPVGAPVPAAEEASKLLLTPALRVVQTETAPEPRGIDDVLAAVSAGVDQQAHEDWEPETGDASMMAAEAPIEAAIWEDVPPIEDYAAPVAFVSTRVKETAEAPAALSPSPAEESEAEAVAAAGSQDAEQAAFPVEVALAETFEFVVQSPSDADALPGWAQSQGADDEDRARPDPVVSGTVEPDPVWADAAEAAVLQELQGARPASPQAAEADDDLDGDVAEVPVNEAMLREIVRDVLREELQGRLGERITRNIRKLVRAEISRMMAAEDLF